MSQSQPRETDPEVEYTSEITSNHEQTLESPWKRVYHNNKGIFLILLAQVAGSSMDAIARFLQLGGTGMHPFQVRAPFFSIQILLLFYSKTAASFPYSALIISRLNRLFLHV